MKVFTGFSLINLAAYLAIPLASGDFRFSVATGIATVENNHTTTCLSKDAVLINIGLNMQKLRLPGRYWAGIYSIWAPLISILKLQFRKTAARRHIIIRTRNISKYSITGQMAVSMVNSKVMLFFSELTLRKE